MKHIDDFETMLCELRNANIHLTIKVRGEAEQRAIRTFKQFSHRKSRNGQTNYSLLKYKNQWKQRPKI